jgi:Tfp pilus assembly protein PilF
MAAEATKHLERAKKYLEKNKLESAVEEYEAALEAVPNSYEVIQALADLHLRLNQPERAARYYGMLFDRFVECGDPS